ncbi:hypothetical protein VFPPC_15856 [Pochonia chlamydosporia 170]|uniref:Uncharacterized protein n=1 Tax=Pochonia chlamydosporia 170 TaxID=1380566 RepID=A0A179FTE4_METCM|nr:hypothetical protein VFPPC_15856 [Pochonia chlamydosporia 170]OAQ68637.1 hypothetical protein VFPPC_15856 [Pochonia chlamydosporia 170]
MQQVVLSSNSATTQMHYCTVGSRKNPARSQRTAKENEFTKYPQRRGATIIQMASTFDPKSSMTKSGRSKGGCNMHTESQQKIEFERKFRGLCSVAPMYENELRKLGPRKGAEA